MMQRSGEQAAPVADALPDLVRPLTPQPVRDAAREEILQHLGEPDLAQGPAPL